MLAGEMKAGSIFEMDGQLYTCVDRQHHQQPRLASKIHAQLKNMRTGGVIEKHFNMSDKLNEVEMQRKEMQFLYNDGDLYYFMDGETFEQIPVAFSEVKNAMKYNTEGSTYIFTSIDGKLMSVLPQTFVNLKVVECAPSIAGDTARNAMKDAKLESGLTIKVPMFVKTGDMLKVDTRTDSYVERV